MLYATEYARRYRELNKICGGKMDIRQFRDSDLVQMIEIWNEVVEIT